MAHSAVWSPDEKQIAFAQGSSVLIADSQATNPRQVAALSGAARFLRFSPDGARLRFAVANDQAGTSAIWEVQADGKDLHPVLPGWHDPARQYAGVWSPDGRYYLFVNGDPTHAELFALAEARGIFHKKPAPIQITTGPALFTFGVPSPDGKKFYADGWSPRSELVRYDKSARGFVPYLSGISADMVDFSRDRKWVVYVSVPDVTLWRSRVDGSDRLQLTFPPATAFFPHWSPDNTQIVYTDNQPGKPWKAFIISAQGGTATEMYAEKNYQTDPNFSPDGKRIAFGRVPFIPNSSDKIDIRILDVGSNQVSIVPGSENLYAPRWSPDGQHMAALSGDNKKLMLYDFKTQKWTDWVSGIGLVSTPAWSRDSKYLYFDNFSGDRPGYRRVKVVETKSEFSSI